MERIDAMALTMRSNRLPHARWGNEWIIATWILSACLGLILTRAFEQQAENRRTADFVVFYAVSGMNPADLYNPKTQTETFDQVHPIEGGAASYGYFSYPPFVALALRPLSALSYTNAYRTEQVLCGALFLLALLTAVRAFLPGRYRLWALMLPLAFVYEPFVAETWLNGQLSIIGFVAICVALAAIATGRVFLGGLALALCLYKPTLLILLAPMLVVTRQARALAGFATGSVILIFAAAVSFGWQIWLDYAHFVLLFGRMERLRPVAKYVDLMALNSLLSGPRALAAALLVAVAAILVILMFRLFRCGVPNHVLWAMAIVWTMVVNFYVPIYDTILIIPAMVVIASAIPLKYSAWATVVLLASSWITQPLAPLIHFQLISAEFLCLGLLLTAHAAKPIAAHN